MGQDSGGAGRRAARLTRRGFNQLLVASAGAASSLGAAAQEPPVPLDTFFQNPAFGQPRFSPDGKSLAVSVAARNGRMQLVVIDVAQLTAKVVAGYADGDIAMFHWVNDDRLVYNVADRQVAPGETYKGWGLFAVDRDGSDFRQLVDRDFSIVREHSTINRHSLAGWTQLVGTTRLKKSDDVFVEQAESGAARELHHVRLLRLNTRTGRTTELRGPDQVVDWVLDQNDEPRVATVLADGKRSVQYRDPATDAWRVLDQRDIFDYGGFEPHGFGPDGTFYVLAAQRSDCKALYRYDLAAGRLDPEPLVSIKGYDFAGELLLDKDRLLGAHYVSDAASTAWLDRRYKAVQDKVDALLPATINRLEVPLRAEHSLVVVRAFSDRDPGTVYLFDPGADRLTLLGKVMRDIDPRRMARRDLVRYKAADGLEIPAWLTLPPGAGKNLPMVVLVHGGPYVRGGTWSWRPDAQFLASRGYAVLEPEYRGSTGYGFRHFRAGWKQWGLKMQSDIADGTRWAIAQGIADPHRVCIAGASYGGYATLMGLVNDPDLYKCGIDWVGVTDIEMMYTVSWSDASEIWQRYGMPQLVGDRVKDAEQLRQTSPLHQAARIRQPLLLAYGGVDRRVPIVHGLRFRDAVQQTNPNVEWIEYRLEGHGWALVANRVDFWTRVEKFLARNLGAAGA